MAMQIFKLSLLLFVTTAFTLHGETAKFMPADSGSNRATVGQFDRIVPLVLNGSGFSTSLTFTNLDTKTLNLVVYFFKPDGSELSLPVTDVGQVTGLNGTLPVNQTLTIDTDGSGDFVEGFAAFFTLDKPASDRTAQVTLGNLGGSALIRGSGSDGAPFEATTAMVPNYETRFTIPFDNRGSSQTVILLLNGSTQSSPLNATVRDKFGNILTKDTGTVLKPLQRIAFPLVEVFPQTTGQTGVLQVSTTAIGLSGLAMRVDQNGRFTIQQTLSAVTNPDAPKPPSTATSLSGISGTSCSAIEGAVIFAADGQYLGKITSNTLDPDALGNTFGSYGSQYSSTSIFNSFSLYGGSYSALSPFNPYTTTPPVIFVGGRAAAYLTINASKTPGLAPTAIYPCIGKR